MSNQEVSKEKDSIKEVKTKITNLQRRLARFLAAVLIIIISIGTPVVLVMAILETFKTANAAIDAVEPYCTVRYNTDVEAYKACIKMPANKIIEDITAEIKAIAEEEAKSKQEANKIKDKK